MLRMLNLSQRLRQPEVMDQPDLDEASHLQALRGLERINFWSGSVRILWPPILSLARQTGRRPLRILDIATGAGDLPIGLWRKARKAGVCLQIEGWDLSPRAVAHARQRAAHTAGAPWVTAGVPCPRLCVGMKGDGRSDAATRGRGDAATSFMPSVAASPRRSVAVSPCLLGVQFFERDALAGDIPPNYDVVVCSLFLHHLDEEPATELLRRMARAAQKLVLVNDLRRSAVGFMLAQVATRLLTASPVVHIDGPRSVQGAFTVEEVRVLAEKAGLQDVRVIRHWPCRYLLVWRRP